MPFYYSPIRIYCQSASHRAIQWSTFLFDTRHIYWFDPKYVLCKFVCYYNAIIMWKRKKTSISTLGPSYRYMCTWTHIEQTFPAPLKLINFLVLGMQNTYEATRMHLWKIFVTPFILHALNQINTKNEKKCTKINRKIARRKGRHSKRKEIRSPRKVWFAMLHCVYVYTYLPHSRKRVQIRNIKIYFGQFAHIRNSLGLVHFYFRIQQLNWLFL